MISQLYSFWISLRHNFSISYTVTRFAKCLFNSVFRKAFCGRFCFNFVFSGLFYGMVSELHIWFQVKRFATHKVLFLRYTGYKMCIKFCCRFRWTPLSRGGSYMPEVFYYVTVGSETSAKSFLNYVFCEHFAINFFSVRRNAPYYRGDFCRSARRFCTSIRGFPRFILFNCYFST